MRCSNIILKGPAVTIIGVKRIVFGPIATKSDDLICKSLRSFRLCNPSGSTSGKSGNRCGITRGCLNDSSDHRWAWVFFFFTDAITIIILFRFKKPWNETHPVYTNYLFLFFFLSLSVYSFLLFFHLTAL